MRGSIHVERGHIQITIVCGHWADALCPLESDPAAVFPLISSGIAKNAGRLVGAVDVVVGCVERSIEHRKGVDYGAGRAWFSTVDPGAVLRIVDSEGEASICPD